MKKIIAVLVLMAAAQLGMAQLKVEVREADDQLIVQFPAGQTFEYKIMMLDPLSQEVVEMQFSKVAGGKAPSEVNWHTAAGIDYKLHYRYNLPGGALSEWIILDPRAELEGN